MRDTIARIAVSGSAQVERRTMPTAATMNPIAHASQRIPTTRTPISPRSAVPSRTVVR